ncbi:KH domain protein [uncultured archaeon]|nr:KH domain protein [uncultured archaeon]
MVTISNDELKCISLFEQMTGASPEDCVIEPERVVFIVKEGEMGRAIGKGGSTIKRVREAFGKHVDVFEAADSLESFVRKLYAGIELKELKVSDAEGGKAVQISVNSKDRGAAIGRNGERIKLARMLLERKYGAKLKLV